MCCLNESLVFLTGINRTKVPYLPPTVVCCGITRANNHNVSFLKICYDKKNQFLCTWLATQKSTEEFLKNCYQVDSMKVDDSPLMSNVFYFDKNR